VVNQNKFVGRLIFVSYSSKDEKIVRPLAHLIDAAGVEIFFADETIPYGSSWRTEIYAKLRAAFRTLVFWSLNAAASQWVRREYRYAIRRKIPVVPVLLDSTDLPPELARYQALTDLVPMMQKALEIEKKARVAQKRIKPGKSPFIDHYKIDPEVTAYLALMEQFERVKNEVTKMVMGFSM
jgi:hypothetical protein